MAIAEPAPTPAPINAATPETVWPRWRVIAIRVWAGLLSVMALMMAPGILLIGSAAPDERFMYATSTVWKLLSLGAVAVVMWTGGRNVAAYWALGVGQLTWLIAGVIAPQPDGNGIILGLVNLLIFYGPLILLRPRRRELLHPGFQPDPVLLTLALAGAVPLTLHAASCSHRGVRRTRLRHGRPLPHPRHDEPARRPSTTRRDVARARSGPGRRARRSRGVSLPRRPGQPRPYRRAPAHDLGGDIPRPRPDTPSRVGPFTDPRHSVDRASIRSRDGTGHPRALLGGGESAFGAKRSQSTCGIGGISLRSSLQCG